MIAVNRDCAGFGICLPDVIATFRIVCMCYFFAFEICVVCIVFELLFIYLLLQLV